VLEESPISGLGNLSIQSSTNCVIVFSLLAAYNLSLFKRRSDMRKFNPFFVIFIYTISTLYMLL